MLRELLFGPLGFNEIARGLPGISRSILAQRLRRLTDLGIIEHGDQLDTGAPGYWLTYAGEQLGESVKSLGAWAAAWVMEDPSQAELDPDLLVLWISRHIDADALPTRRAVVAFDLRGPRSSRSWLVLEQPAGVSICHEDPRLDQRDYIYVQADTRALYRLYMGHLTFARRARRWLGQAHGWRRPGTDASRAGSRAVTSHRSSAPRLRGQAISVGLGRLRGGARCRRDRCPVARGTRHEDPGELPPPDLWLLAEGVVAIVTGVMTILLVALHHPFRITLPSPSSGRSGVDGVTPPTSGVTSPDS